MTSETTRQLDDRAKLEAAVGKVARAYHELVRLIEASKTITETDIGKAFTFLANVHGDSRSKAELSLRTALAANGGFSLDKEYAPVTSITQPTARAAERLRLVGQSKPKPPVDNDGVDFIED
ncbi:hypothetical protein [Shinella zoogloeoides]|uniref:hypothetical protein n=1 Tax=Shinella zoogloeoides TaxID=352475 RepID=UPI00273F7A4A|nr:hypothetical protein [Shinella zoogloeoides]WLR90876.1 hypothetical protein Q9316_00435 [Shinella zoogloeoides]